MPEGCILTLRREVASSISPDSEEYKKIVDSVKKDFMEEKAKMEVEFAKILKDKDIEITMQKVTIQHLQDALVALKRGQPFPVPPSSYNANNPIVVLNGSGTAGSNNNGGSGVSNSGKVFEI
jgi:hypothetical protein